VKNLGHNVIGVARTHSDPVAFAKNKKPGLILADIQLVDGRRGLDAVIKNELLCIGFSQARLGECFQRNYDDTIFEQS
jgi:hypothetical protein